MYYRQSLLLTLILYLFMVLNAGATTYACTHRGDKKNAPENTVPAIMLAVEKGAQQIEFDVQRTSDGHLVIMHDATVDRTTNGSGEISTMSLKQVRALDAGAWFSEAYTDTKVPTLEEILAPIPITILCNVHLKGNAQLGADTAKALSAMKRLDHCFLACTLEQAAAAKQAVPEIMICNMSRQGRDRKKYIDTTIEAGTDFIQLFYGNGTGGLAADVARLHAHNIRVNWFGASKAPLIRTLMEANMDYILTDDLDLCLEVMGRENAGFSNRIK